MIRDTLSQHYVVLTFLFDSKVIQMFRGCKQEDMPPHIYASAQTTYRNMLATNADQSLVFMGPSGSGKSVNCAHLLHYFCSTSVSPQSSLTGKVLDFD